MNKKNKQAVAIALALVMCAGALLYDPHPVMAAEQYPVLSNGFVFSDISHNGGGYDGYIRNWYISNLESTDAVYALAYYDSCDIHDATTHAPQYYYLFSNSAFSFDRTIELDSNGTAQKDEIATNHFSSVTDRTGTLKGYFCPFSVSKVGQKITDYPIGYDAYKGDLSAYEVMNIILSGDLLDGLDFGNSSTYEDAVDELGYLQNVAFKSVRVASTTEPPIIYLPIDRFTFSNTTTKDVLMNDVDYDVEYFIVHRSYASKSDYDKKNIYKKSWSDLYYLSKQEHVFNESTVNSIDNGVLWYYFDSDSSSWVSKISEGLNRTYAVYSSIVFMRPIKRDGNSLKCGGWTKIDFDLNNSPHVTNGHNPFDDNNPQGMPDEDGNFGDIDSEKDIDYDIGYGDNVDDAANDNSNIDDIIDFVNDFDLSSLSNILSQLGEAASAFADLLGVVFGWMPTWVRGSLIAAVCIWIFMLIKRAIF